MDTNNNCWVCGADGLKVIKQSDIDGSIDSNNYAITNADYGKTGELSQCQNCGFIMSCKENDVIHFYEDLVDHEYENTRAERKLQETAILKLIQQIKPSGKLLDIGAGSGIMVESALEMGYEAEGVEPSKWLHQQAVKRNLPIHLGTFPSAGATKQYDIITLVDVIEHVNNPKQLLLDINEFLAEDGVFVVITPDVNSIMAKMLKWKWWHFRVAHIGYFNSKNLQLLLKNTSFKSIRSRRPAWYFRTGYLIDRVYQYLPKIMRIPAPNFIRNIVIPLNLRDSLLVVCKKA